MCRLLSIAICSSAMVLVFAMNDEAVTAQEPEHSTLLARLKAVARVQKQDWNETAEAAFSREFKRSRVVFPVQSQKEDVNESVTKVAGELNVFHAYRTAFDNRAFSVTMEPRKFPLEADFYAIRDNISQLPAEKRAERAITAWYLMRCNGSVSSYGAPQFEALGKEYVVFAQSLGYVKIVSTPKNARVEVVGWGEWDPTDTEGFLPPGKALIFVRLEGYTPQFKMVDVQHDKSHTVEFTLKRAQK